ncbi:molybdopterin-guanine dinucleotide biosynthesis protein B [Peribacillus deserti]|uniref:Molybdopterin-guanine dinucleotide biosynthesis protein B n=1 Tax=Peribacillus deserti TaxID=673318 RepID=A0A2N5M7S6_9BACI|nr:molybdopterin-guanine dinucleotide biosynthesis protein B [Peribacillus deserti]PLT30406.1 molybdopterin-guanine dinucleotide biosynthesis protein B [Peribacillus deserti]
MTAIFQICGFQNSGKTTLLTALIQALKDKGVESAVIKHHGHGGPLAVRENQKDSEKYLQAGAVVSLAAGRRDLQLLANVKEWDLERKIQFMSFFNPDLILIEGYKYEKYPKAVLLKNKEDAALIDETLNVKAAVYWPEAEEGLIQKKVLSI